MNSIHWLLNGATYGECIGLTSCSRTNIVLLDHTVPVPAVIPHNYMITTLYFRHILSIVAALDTKLCGVDFEYRTLQMTLSRIEPKNTTKVSFWLV